jgi:hypothetical protein
MNILDIALMNIKLAIFFDKGLKERIKLLFSRDYPLWEEGIFRS